ncbi:LAO/AO transport system kinase [Actinoplanes octamycinicus]|uniref:LAO/AO transport system kinase n=1 Tax=Actinoplanes octamycinicus TaxID=135948 RepID=A0A7W7GY33_9ACTN|nr:methylmalonyl Co-A mutase-associated GTPase MeaB [Actinoplanes octamycinicus]MBB4740398.1 LAO/AO transport system kinase [Actinoplanes octamycinicus]GIE59659.1 putative GTPase [Actinoplanes octamycinicus]
MTSGRPVDVEQYAAGVRAGAPAWVSRAITLVESVRPDHRSAAQRLLTLLQATPAAAVRVGVTGVPGAGKSTFIDALGSRLVENGHRVAVLAVDPSSTRTGGSVLGDRTRMARLSAHPAAFVRPSPSGGTLGGVARATREAMVVVEAAGYDVVLVESVGVGQSEVDLAGMVDTMLLLTLAGTGDQLQGIKRGILESADIIAVNKSDGPNLAGARLAARELAVALRLLTNHTTSSWRPPVLTCSARENTGIAEIWRSVTEHHARSAASGELSARRERQRVDWLWALVRDGLAELLTENPVVRREASAMESEVAAGKLPPATAAERILAALHGNYRADDGE